MRKKVYKHNKLAGFTHRAKRDGVSKIKCVGVPPLIWLLHQHHKLIQLIQNQTFALFCSASIYVT